MVVNTQQLQYLVEIQRTGSISHAAANLYMSQPNLSRVLRDLENSLGFPIFERTRKGVRPTPKGEKFLHHARNILRETGYMAQLGSCASAPSRLRVCIPRSYGYVDFVQRFLSGTCQDQELQVLVRECHPRRALELVAEGSSEIAVVRYLEQYQDYFAEQASLHRLELVPLGQTVYQLLTHRDSPLALEQPLSREQLVPYTELIHRDDPSVFQCNPSAGRFIYTVDRMSQLQLLQSLPAAYLWSEPLPDGFLRQNGLIQRSCADVCPVYREALLFNPQCGLSDLEKAFLADLRAQMDKSGQNPPDIPNF